MQIQMLNVCREQIRTCEQLPLSKFVSFVEYDQQHCSRFNQNACGQMPNFKSVIQLAPMSITPATQPEAKPTSNTHTQPDHASCAPYKQIKTRIFRINLAQKKKKKKNLVRYEAVTIKSLNRLLLKNPTQNLEFFSLCIDVSSDLWLCHVASQSYENPHIARFPVYHHHLHI